LTVLIFSPHHLIHLGLIAHQIIQFGCIDIFKPFRDYQSHIAIRAAVQFVCKCKNKKKPDVCLLLNEKIWTFLTLSTISKDTAEVEDYLVVTPRKSRTS